MKLVAVLIMVVMATAVFAQEVSDDAQAEADAGMLPDAPLYGLDIAFEKISLALAGDQFSRAKLALEQAKEHLAEARVMAKKEKPEARDKALKQHDERLADINANKNGLSEEHRAEVEENIGKHLMVLRNVQSKLEVKGVPAATGGVANAIENSQKVLDDVRGAKSQKGLQGIEQNVNNARSR